MSQISNEGQQVRLPRSLYNIMKKKAEDENRNIGAQIEWELMKAGIIEKPARNKAK